jgi:hypothetical protein
MQILTSRFIRWPFDQEGLTEHCNIIGKDKKTGRNNRETHEKERKKKQTTPPTNPKIRNVPSRI